MKRLLLVPLLLLLMACPSTSTISLIINLSVSGTINVLKLADPSLPQATIDTAQNAGNLLISAYNDYTSAPSASKPGVWPKVQDALAAFQKDLPALIVAAHITNPVYVDIANLVLTEIQSVVNSINGTAPASSSKKSATLKAANLDASTFKKAYNQKMATAGHPELKL